MLFCETCDLGCQKWRQKREIEGVSSNMKGKKWGGGNIILVSDWSEMIRVTMREIYSVKVRIR